VIDIGLKMRRFKLNPINTKNSLTVAIGIFDGIHLGHQVILKELLKSKPSGIITFYKHPRTGVKLIQPFSQRISSLKDWGVNTVFALSKRDNVLEKSTEDFIENIIKPLNINKIIVGKDFRLGHNRDTDVNKFKIICKNQGIELKIIPIVLEDDQKLSSTNIRKHIMSGEIENANELLGHPFKIRGLVVKGAGLGKKIGFSTANLIPHHLKQVVPANGVYKTRTKIDNMVYDSFTYIGTNPTLKDGKSYAIETHIPGFTNNLHGKLIELDFIKKTREEKKFNSTEELIKAIKADTNF
jgi:riboflavin kinase / FMN adenylyltransferase